MEEKESFEGWAIIELFGHNQIAGFVSEQSIGGESFIRVDVPMDEGEGFAFTKFYGGKAIYAITPVTEEAARMAANRLEIRPVSVWIVPHPKLLSTELGGSEQHIYGPEDDEDDDLGPDKLPF